MAETHQARWAFAEWKQLVERRFGGSSPLVYSQGTGRAAALVPHRDGTLGSWGCAGGPASSSRSAACVDSGPWRGLGAVLARRCVCHGRHGNDISYIVDKMI